MEKIHSRNFTGIAAEILLERPTLTHGLLRRIRGKLTNQNAAGTTSVLAHGQAVAKGELSLCSAYGL